MCLPYQHRLAVQRHSGVSEVIPLSVLTGARPPWWHDAYGVLLRTSLVVGWLPGFTLGLVLMLELALFHQVGIGWWPHAETHAHAQRRRNGPRLFAQVLNRNPAGW